MATNNQGIVNVGTPGSAASGYHTRRLFNFSDRVAELAPEESPFFTYLSKTAKLPTDDSLFRYLEDRSKVDYTSREFLVKGTTVTTVAADTEYQLIVDTVDGASVDWLIKGMVFAVRTTGNAAANVGFGQAIFRIETAPADGGTDTSFRARCLSISGATGANTLANKHSIRNSHERIC